MTQKIFTNMKKLLLITLLLCGISQAWAAEWTDSNGISWTFDVSGTEATNIKPTDRSTISGAVVIPGAVYNGETELSVTSIGSSTSYSSGAFYNCTGLTSVTIPSSVTSIGSYAFYKCSGLTSVTIPSRVTFIGDCAFWGCSGLTSVTIPSSVTSIGNLAFAYCRGLTSVTIPSSVTSIGTSAFKGCSGLTSVTIPSSVTSIGREAFEDTPFYNNQPVGLVYLGSVAYKYKGTMPANTEIVIADGTVSIGYCAFMDCLRLTSVTIPSSVTSIGEGAFYCCCDLTSVTIPSSVTSIGSSVFYGCTGLTNVTIPEGVTSIGDYAFYKCSGLTSVTIPEGVTSIGSEAFYNCTGLTSVIIPSNVTSIGDYAFKGCSNLTSVYCYLEIPLSIGSSTFNNYDTATLYVPYGCKTAFENAQYWQNFSNIVEMEPVVPDPTEVTLTVSDAGVGTFASAYDLDFTDVSGIKAYIASGFDSSTGRLLLTQVDEVPAGTGLYVKGTAGDYTIPVKETTMFYMNLLVGLTEDTCVAPTTDTHTNFILANGKYGISFYTLSQEGVIVAGKAYLSLPTEAVVALANGITLEFDDEETTGISDEVIVNSEKSVDVWYTVDGQKIEGKPTQKGVYIVNGKKMVIK